MDEFCHCGARFGRMDHCPCCGCEEYERYCTGRCPDPDHHDHDHEYQED